MTPKQVQLLDFIRSTIEATGSPPTYSQMSEKMKITRSNVHMMVERLIRGGHLARFPNVARGLYLSGPNRSLVDVPTSALRAELARREAAA